VTRKLEDHAMSESKEVLAHYRRYSEARLDLLEQYGSGSIQFCGATDALYERQLLFDVVVALAAAGLHERLRPVGRSVKGCP
jgi:hypothetical protein